MKDGIYRNTCPRNCYGSCSILSYVKNDRLVKVTGDPKHGFTKGRLCAKGYASTQFVYNPQRLKYPMRQIPRGSGNWQRISWDEAYTIIAGKIIELNQRYGSNLACGYNKFSGNLGLLHYAVEGMFNSLGPHTKPIGNPCALTGKHAVNQSFGDHYSADPEEMARANLIVIWGSNPAVTNVHQMKFIYEARRKGAKLVVIDPIFTRTAEKADLYLQINPGTDGWLAGAIAKLIIEKGIIDEEAMVKQTIGWEEYQQFLHQQINLAHVAEQTGVPIKAMVELAELYGKVKPAATWAGLGIQRSDRGGRSISAINSLAVMTGMLSDPGSGLYYMHFEIEHFPQRLACHDGPVHPTIPHSREVDMSHFSKNALALTDPPLKLLWVASRNIVTQDQNLHSWQQLFQQLELIVTVDLYLTKTAKQADIVLPAATHFEEEDLHVGYWHYWLSINQKVLPPYYEAKSDLQIARELTRRLNELSPGFSNFPYEKEPIDWIKTELSPEIMRQYGINGYEDLLDGPHKKVAQTHSLKKYNLFPAIETNLLQGDQQQPFTYRLLSPQSLLKIHSQYECVSWLTYGETDNIIELSTMAANEHEINENTKIEIYNEQGAITGVAKINPTLPRNVVLASQAGSNPINQLIFQKEDHDANGSSTFFYDSIVKIRKGRDTHG